jgi:predicted RNA-binding Zn-ribbon protein involved in translation (DUF1610 family)
MSQSLVRATCPTCGDVVLTARDLRLDQQDRWSRVLFTCPRCRQQVSHDIPSGVVSVLRSAGVPQIVAPPELISPEELAEFLADFDRVDCLEQLRRLESGA